MNILSWVGNFFGKQKQKYGRESGARPKAFMATSGRGFSAPSRPAQKLRAGGSRLARSESSPHAQPPHARTQERARRRRQMVALMERDALRTERMGFDG